MGLVKMVTHSKIEPVESSVDLAMQFDFSLNLPALILVEIDRRSPWFGLILAMSAVLFIGVQVMTLQGMLFANAYPRCATMAECEAGWICIDSEHTAPTCLSCTYAIEAAADLPQFAPANSTRESLCVDAILAAKRNVANANVLASLPDTAVAIRESLVIGEHFRCPSVAVNTFAKTSSVSLVVFLVASLILVVEVSRDTIQNANVRRCRLAALPIRPRSRGLITGFLVPLMLRFVEAMQRYLVYACVLWTFFSMVIFAKNGLSAVNIILNGVAVAFVCNLDDLFADFFAPQYLERSAAIRMLQPFYLDGIRDDAHLASVQLQTKRTAHGRALVVFIAFVRGYYKLQDVACSELKHEMGALASCYCIWIGAFVEIAVGALFLRRRSVREWASEAGPLVAHEVAEVVVVCLVMALFTLAVDDQFWAEPLYGDWSLEAGHVFGQIFGALGHA